MSNVEILEFEPFIKFKGEAIPSQEDILLIKAFTEIAQFTIINMSRVLKLDQQMLSQYFRLLDLNQDAENTLLTYISYSQLDEEKKRLNLNFKKVAQAKEVITLLRNVFDEVRLGLRDFSSLEEDSQEIKEIEEVANQALKKKISNASKIVYKFSGAEKIDDFDDQIDLIEENRKSERIAKESFTKLDKKFSEKGLLSSKLNESRSSLSNLAYYENNNNKSMDRSIDNINKSSTFIEENKFKYSQRKLVKESNQNASLYQKSSTYNFSEVLPKQDEELAQEKKFKKSEIFTDNKRYNNIGEQYLNEKEDKYEEKNKENVQKNINKEPKLKRMEMNMAEKEDSKMSSSKIEDLEKQISLLKKSNMEITKQLDIIEKQSGKNLISLKDTNINKLGAECLALKSWNVSLLNSVKSKYSESFTAVKLINELNLAITGDRLGQISFWSLNGLQEIHSIAAHEGSVTSLLYLHDRKNILSCGSDGKLIKFNLNNFDYETILNNNLLPLSNLCANPLSKSIFVSSNEFILELDIENKKRINKFRAHDDKITDLIADLSREILISCSKDKLIKIWNLKTKENEGIMEGHFGEIKSICYNEEKSELASIGKDNIITFWNLENSNLTKSLKMDSLAEKILYLKDGKTYLTISKDGKFLLWSSETDKFKAFQDDLDSYSCCSFGYDGKAIILGTDEGSLELWSA